MTSLHLIKNISKERAYNFSDQIGEKDHSNNAYMLLRKLANYLPDDVQHTRQELEELNCLINPLGMYDISYINSCHVNDVEN